MEAHVELQLECLAKQDKQPTLREVWIAYAAFTLKECNWSKFLAARRLGIGRATMYRLANAADFKAYITRKNWSEFVHEART